MRLTECYIQSWESFFLKVIYYILLVTFMKKSYITLSKSNSVILLLLSEVIILSNLVTSYQVTLKVHVCRTLIFTKKTGLLRRIYGK